MRGLRWPFSAHFGHLTAARTSSDSSGSKAPRAPEVQAARWRDVENSSGGGAAKRKNGEETQLPHVFINKLSPEWLYTSMWWLFILLTTNITAFARATTFGTTTAAAAAAAATLLRKADARGSVSHRSKRW